MYDLEVVEVKNQQGKPRVKFCWNCGKKLRGNHYAEVTFSDGYKRILHKDCAKKLSSD